MTLQPYNIVEGKTSTIYNFPEGYKEGTHVGVPFPYLVREDVEVYQNDIKLSLGVDYSFEISNGSIYLRNITGNPCTVTIKRNTPITETSKTKSLVYAIQEAKDETGAVKPTLAAVDVTLGKLEQMNIDTYNDLKEKIDATKDTFEARIGIVTDIGREGDTDLRDAHNDLRKGYTEFLRKTGADITLLQYAVDNNKDKWKPSFDTLSRDLNTATRINIDDIGELKEQVKTLTEKLKTLEGSACKCQDTPPKDPQDDARIKALEKSLKETMSALNIETQVRRREDAQIKTLLKHLLAKFDRLEDFVAGDSPDLGSTVLDELRSEMKRQDDTLGRTHLESLVRYGEVSDRLADLGRTDMENIARLARLKAAISERT